MSKGWKKVRLVDQPSFGRSVILEWRKRRGRRPDAGCGVGSFTEQDPRIAPVRARLTTRAGRWATWQVGRGRTVAEAEEELGCSWHTASKEVNRRGEALLRASRTGWDSGGFGVGRDPVPPPGLLAAEDVDTAAVDIRNRNSQQKWPASSKQETPPGK